MSAALEYHHAEFDALINIESHTVNQLTVGKLVLS